ncbi:extracellular ligand-binding receptor [Parafrankia sp. EUN1f]|nr:extracellular ligand-binding receptor [Parafrankia sp. EUN1f]
MASAPGIDDKTILLGGSFPLSGALSANGQAALGGIKAFIDATNEAGGVRMSDGVIRRIEFKYYDDGYDPARVVQNFRKLVDQDQVFAYVGAFGTATNAAVMPLATRQEIPQVLLGTGASVFSADQKKNPWTIGWQPTYEQEGESFGKYLVSLNRTLKVGFLGQNDDLGDAYRNGLTEAIKGSRVSIVADVTYERTDTSLDSQISTLAGSHADVLFSAVAIPRLESAVLARMAQLGWAPMTYLPIMSNSATHVIKASGAVSFPEMFSGEFAKVPDNPIWAGDKAVQSYLADMKKYSPEADATIANAVWAYSAGDALVRALEGMKDLSRQDLMTSIHALDYDDAPMLLPDLAVNGSDSASPPIHELQVEKFIDNRWELIEDSEKN